MDEMFDPATQCLLTDFETQKGRVLRMEARVSEDGKSGHIGWGAFPDIENGEYTGRGFVISVADKKFVEEALIRSANETLPSGTRYEIRRVAPWNYGRSHSMWWENRSEMRDSLSWEDLVKTSHDAALGSWICRRLVSKGRENA